MSNDNANWADGWIAMQQAFLKSMSSISPPGTSDTKTEDAKPPMQEQFYDLQETWKESIEKWAGFVQDGAGPGAWTPTALREMFSPARWSGRGAGAFDAGLQQVIEGPKYATLWDLDRKVAELQQMAIARDKAVLAYQAIVQRAWNTALERFMKTASSAKGETPTTWRGLTDRWLKVANETLIEAHRSEEFVVAQTRMLRAASDYRLKERALAESWCDAYHVPTRTEVDEIQRTVTELRRQVRLLQRQNAPQQPVPATATATPARQGRGVAPKASRSIQS
ncbi:Poly(R)-hydroxyalkanoic acid synthase subunit (PHA_synth_III_E) [Caballeronia pedi]|uniref:Poly(3-hydroxyalkanoate) polymerase subunit PhaE n=1 Tax=Caballeronia pedi TaxID=1777141 RepID=A0A158E6L6_9BURK|nr:poly(R)-hydroxyalkanoic acid synthase subunit PhaE [Caballeronia pedi]SAL02403.1 Poly(R)-hydroxyalkanoic acid synthase subunit (PHA_synth_III_E) [Caballeronia pedi]